MTSKGISWLAMQYGKPINKFVRSGLSVNVYVLKKDDSITGGILKVDNGKEELCEVLVNVLTEREYGRKVYQVKNNNGSKDKEKG
ncbi:hypothetical protein LINPERPRIM_LOCUS31497 [Linum perenne]